MSVDANWVAAVASVASAFVVAIAAVAAFVQVSHVRNSNEITVFLRMVDRLDSLESEAAFAGVDAFVARVRTDSAFRMRLAQSGTVEEFRPIASVLQFIEHLSTLLVTGRITERLVLAEYADNIEELWDSLRETIYLRRAVRGPHVGAAFEHVAMRSKRFIASGGMDRFYGRLQKDPRMAAFASSSATGVAPD